MTKFYVTFLDGLQAVFEGEHFAFNGSVLEVDDMVIGSVRLFRHEKVVDDGA